MPNIKLFGRKEGCFIKCALQLSLRFGKIKTKYTLSIIYLNTQFGLGKQIGNYCVQQFPLFEHLYFL